MRFVFGRVTLVFCFCVLLGGCARMSPAVGTWTGADLPGVGASVVTLNPDGKGFAKIGPLPEQPVTWTEENGKVTLSVNSAQAQAPETQPTSARAGNLVGTLSEDQATLSVDLGVMKATLRKQKADSK